MSLSRDRMRRPNAGSRMSSMIDSNDEFYDNIYGGFNDEEEDDSYKSESSDSDSVDSDFSIDECDEPISDDQNEDQLDNKKSKTKFSFSSKKGQKKGDKRVVDGFKVPVKVELPFGQTFISDRSLRSTERKAKNSFIEKMKTRNKKQKRNEVKSNKKIERKELSQQEMLEEAAVTERINLQSLEEYRKLELEKANKSKFVKRSIKGPFIRYRSVSMPLIEEVNDDNHNELIIDDNNNPPAKTYSRTFISFSDGENYESFLHSMKSSSPPVPKVPICPVTQFPARYIDPVSQLPFATSQAFSAIRSQYLKNLEVYGNTSQLEVAQWIDWRQENEEKWIHWQQKYCSYDETIHNESDAQSTHSQSFISKVNSIPKVTQLSRRGRKSKK